MKQGNKVVFGIYKSRSSVESAIEKFRTDGFRAEDISVLLPERSAGESHTGSSMPAFGGVETQNASDISHVKASKAPEGATTGAGTGAVLGGTLGWLVGAGALAVTGLGPLVAAGPIIAALAGAGVGGALGTLAGGLIGMGIPEYEAKRFESHIKEGGILLSVHADSSEWVDKAKKLMQTTGAEDVSSTTEADSDSTMGRKTDDRRRDMNV